jgi:hypothetical protein
MFTPPTGIEHQLRGSLVQMNFELLRISLEIIIHHGPGDCGYSWITSKGVTCSLLPTCKSSIRGLLSLTKNNLSLQGDATVRSISLQNLEKLLEILVDGEKSVSPGPLKTWYRGLDETNIFFKDTSNGGEKYRPKEKELNVDHVTSHLVAAYLKAEEKGKGGYKNKHPAKLQSCLCLFSKERAKAVVTYQWKQSLGGKKGLLQMIRDAGISPDTELWVDVWFIDQNCREITKELAISQEYYRLCGQHLIAASGDDSDVTDRAWCLWETSLRAYENKKSQIMGKLKVKVRPPAG